MLIGTVSGFRVLALGVFAGLAASLASSVQAIEPGERVADVLMKRLEDMSTERLCRPFGKFLSEQGAVATTGAAPPEQAAFSVALGAHADMFKASCRDRVHEAFDSPRSPKAQMREELVAWLTSIDARELARLAHFLSSSDGQALGAIEDRLTLEAPAVMTPWMSWFSPKLYEDLKFTMTAELGELPAARPAEPVGAPTRSRMEVTTARVRSRHIAEDCESFYPAEARRAGQEGLVGLLVAVGDNGRLTGIKVETSSGIASLDVAAAACVAAHGEFEPTVVDGRPVASWQRLRWRWVLTEPAPAPTPTPTPPPAAAPGP